MPKVSSLTEATTFDGLDEVLVNQGGVSKKVTATTIKTGLATVAYVDGVAATIPANAVLSDGTVDMDAGYSPLNSLSVSTKEYVDVKISAEGGQLIQVDEGNGVGYRLVNTDPAGAGPIGEGAISLEMVDTGTFYGDPETRGAIGYLSFTGGLATTASGMWGCMAVGDWAVASGNSAVAFGTITNAAGYGAISIGFDTDAIGDYSIAGGELSIANGKNSFAFGYTTQANGWSSVSTGYSNDAFGNYSFTYGQQGVALDGSMTGGSYCYAGFDSMASGYEARAYGGSVFEVLSVTGQNITMTSGTLGSLGNIIITDNPADPRAANFQFFKVTASAGATFTVVGDTSGVLPGYKIYKVNSPSFAFGDSTHAFGNYSFSTGLYNVARNDSQFVAGKYNVGTSIDTILEVGIGAWGAHANGFEVYTDGTATLPEATTTEIATRGNKALTTVEYLLSPEFGNSLPIVDPLVAGKLWNNAGVLTISAG